jgi:hypothetical protein
LSDKKEKETLLWVHPETAWDLGWVRNLSEILMAKPKGRAAVYVVFAATPERWWEILATQEASPASPLGVVLPLQKWKPDFVHPWLNECGFQVGDDSERDTVSALTGGWPCWLYRVVELFGKTKDRKQAMAEFGQWLHAPETATEQLGYYGFGDYPPLARVLQTLKGMRSLVGTDEFLREVDLSVLAETLQVAPDEMRKVVRWAADMGLLDVAGPDCWQWDPVFAARIGG